MKDTINKEIKQIIRSSINLCAITYLICGEDQNITPEEAIDGIDVLIANCQRNEDNFEFCAKMVKAKNIVKNNPEVIDYLIMHN